MRRSLFGVLALAFILGLATGASAHIGDTVYLFFEIPDADVADIDLQDGSVDDWLDVVGDPSVDATDFFADPGVGDGAPYDPADMDYEIWFGWNESTGTLWGAMQRTDDVYINEYAGGDLGDLWRWDSTIEFMFDADHTGGEYGFNTSNCEGCSEEEINLINNKQAQQFTAISEAPDGKTVGYQGKAQEWYLSLPYTDGGGGASGDAPVLSVTEFMVTPGDEIIYNDEDASVFSTLMTGTVVGFQISVPDWDVAGTYHAFHTLTGQEATWRFAERFADARLVGGTGGTAVEENSWGRIKASF